MKQYHAPELEWILPTVTDVIQTSSMTCDPNGNSIYSEIFGAGT